MDLQFAQNELVLFQGDSITDHGRDHADPACLGTGYAMMAASWFTATHPHLDVQFANRGVSGDQTSHLLERWQADCIDLQPTWVSILIGINDAWRPVHDPKHSRSVSEFEADYTAVLELTRASLPKTRIIICEPFLLETVGLEEQFRCELAPRIQIARTLARQYADIYIPFDGIFQAASMHMPPEAWASDAVHPSKAGHALMAKTWLEAVGAI